MHVVPWDSIINIYLYIEIKHWNYGKKNLKPTLLILVKNTFLLSIYENITITGVKIMPATRNAGFISPQQAFNKLQKLQISVIIQA
jgi:hypothetical protein